MFPPKYFARLSRDCGTNENENKQHSQESRETLSRQSRGIFSKLNRNSRICRINVHSMRMQRKSCVCIVNLWRTSLQLSHPIEVGALSMRISLACEFLALASHWHANFSRLFANFVADFLFRSAVFILVSNVCNLRIGIVHYNSTNVKRIMHAFYSFTENFNIHPLRKKGTYYISHLRRNYVYLKKSAMWHPILIWDSIDHYSATVKVRHHQNLYRLDGIARNLSFHDVA